jgi:hypothetical protein
MNKKKLERDFFLIEKVSIRQRQSNMVDIFYFKISLIVQEIVSIHFNDSKCPLTNSLAYARKTSNLLCNSLFFFPRPRRIASIG